MKLILFGANEIAKDFITNTNYNIAYVVDNDINKQGKGIFNLEGVKIADIFNPTKICSESKGNFYVLIMVKTEKYAREIMEQLDSVGLVRKENYDWFFESVYNENYYEWDYRYRKTIIDRNGKIFPSILHLGLSDICNIKCRYCGFHGMKNLNKKRGHFMTMEQAKIIALQAKKITSLKTLYITHDGEDFLNENWFNIVSYIFQETDIKNFVLYTNGMLLNENNINKISKINAEKITVVISIDGESKEENDEIRKGSQYEIIKKNIKYARKTLNDEKYVFMINNNHMLYENEVRQQNYVISKFQLEVPQFLLDDFTIEENIPVISYPTMYLLSDKEGFPEYKGCKYIKVKKSNRIAGCFNPFEQISINAVGDILFCGCSVMQESIGNICKDDILDVWQNNSKIQEARDLIKNQRITPKLCENCSSKISGDFYLVCKEELGK